MISKKIFNGDGAITRFLSDIIIRSEQFARPYVYIYDNTLLPNGTQDKLVDGTTDQANWSWPDNIWKRGSNNPQANDIVAEDKWQVVDNSILYYLAPIATSTVWIEVATTSEEFGDTLTAASVEKAEAAAAESAASAIDATNNGQIEVWKAEAEALTADSYATQTEDILVNTYTSDGDGTFTATPTTEYSALHWAAKSAVDGDKVLKAGDTMTGNLEAPSMSIGGDFVSPYSMRNKIINGGFDFWQRGTSQTASGYGSDDRWDNNYSITASTNARQDSGDTERALFTSPYYSRTVVTSVVNINSYAQKQQAIENVAKLAGKTITLSFWAKADAPKNMAIELVQRFGTGGTPSAVVALIGAQQVALTTTWQKKSITIAVPSIIGKVLGTAGIHTTDTNFKFWFETGSNLDLNASGIGQQSGTFDIAEIQLEEGSVATPFEQRPIGLELSLCQRYYERINSSGRFRAAVASEYSNTNVYFSQEKRVPPSRTLISAPSVSNLLSSTMVILSAYGARHELRATAVGDCFTLGEVWELDAEL